MRITKLKKVTLWMVIVFLVSAVLLAIIRSHKIDAGKKNAATGFFFNTRLQVAYNYNFEVVRHQSYGGHEIAVLFSGKL